MLFTVVLFLSRWHYQTSISIHRLSGKHITLSDCEDVDAGYIDSVKQHYSKSLCIFKYSHENPNKHGVQLQPQVRGEVDPLPVSLGNIRHGTFSLLRLITCHPFNGTKQGQQPCNGALDHPLCKSTEPRQILPWSSELATHQVFPSSGWRHHWPEAERRHI